MYDSGDVDDFFSDADYNDLEVQKGGIERFRLQEGEHKVVVVEDRKLQKKNGDWTYIIKFANDQEQDYTEYLDPITAEDRQTKTKAGDKTIAQVKAQKRVNVLVPLGVPKDKIPSLKPGDLTGIEGTLKLYKSNGYIRFGSFTLTKGGSVGEPLKRSEPDPLKGLDEFAKTSAASDADFGL